MLSFWGITARPVRRTAVGSGVGEGGKAVGLGGSGEGVGEWSIVTGAVSLVRGVWLGTAVGVAVSVAVGRTKAGIVICGVVRAIGAGRAVGSGVSASWII